MPVLLQDGLADDSPPGTPLIGWHNVVTPELIGGPLINGIIVDDPDFPVSNLGNPATHLKWKGPAIDGGSVLNFEDTASPPTWIDDSGRHTWTPQGNTFIDTSQFKFGVSSVRMDGTGDALDGDGSADFEYGTGDFLFEFFVRFNSLANSTVIYDGRGPTPSPVIYKAAGNVPLRFNDGAADRITGTTNIVINTWYHVALSRLDGNTRLHVNGAQEGSTYVDANNYGIASQRPRLGNDGTLGTSGLNGWIDGFRVVKGYAPASVAASPSSYPVPAGAHRNVMLVEVWAEPLPALGVNYVGIAGHNWGTLGLSLRVEQGNSIPLEATLIEDDSPIIVRWSPDSPEQDTVNLVLTYASGQPEAAVFYAGYILALERGIKVDVGHVPITFGRRTSIINGMSETGNFLGRIVLGEYRESKAEFFGFTADFYRQQIDDFLNAAQEIPFFFAYAPLEYPAESGFVWLINNAEPVVSPDHRHIALTLQMRGIA